MNIVYLNGKFMPENEAKVSIFDRGFVMGDGIYEVVPIIDGKLVDKDGFWDRLVKSSQEIDLANPFSKDKCLQMLTSLVKQNRIDEGGAYMQITRGVAKRDFVFLENLKPTCMAFCYKANIINNELAKTGIKVASVEDIRWKRRDIKSISLLAQCKAKTDAYKKGAYEGFMVEDGYVTEGVSSTAYIVKNQTIITTPLTNQILPGVRRKNIIKIAEKLNLHVEFRHFSIDEVKSADEAFISAATLFILPVTSIDDEPINGGKIGKITMQLRQEYIKKIRLELQT